MPSLNRKTWPFAPCDVIVIHLNGTSPFECRDPSCWHTKGHLWIEVCPKHYSLVYHEIHSLTIHLVTLSFNHVEMYSRLSYYTTRASFASLGCYKSRILVFAGCSYTKPRITRRLLYCIPAYMSQTLKHKRTPGLTHPNKKGCPSKDT